ncbi:NAD(P)-binding protein [Cystobasidium minutum MCA 4210]|uniref:NAD(P)-binding protein n=1 Tax=Cystobasidium minutum MCA 4210 TaxID=1397322 RepID=UPI0034CF6A76|eukprot:jgi/Rhomi1/61300/CE61299_4544
MAPRDPPTTSLAGKTAIVTGANIGIGLATALYLASLSCKVILACRTQSKGEAAIQEIKKEHPDAQVELVSLDLQSLSSVRKLVEDWEKRQDNKLDLLICNAGATFVDYARTGDGFEQSYQTNYLSHFLLIRLMTPYLCLSPSPRVILVNSNAASWGKVSIDNLNAEAIPESSWKGLSRFKTGMQVYGNTKLMGLLFMAHYQKLLLESSNPEDHKIAIQAVHPGMVASNMPNANHYNIPKFIGTIVDKAIKLVGRSTATGAKPTLYAALSDEAGQKENWGSFWDENCIKKDIPNEARNDQQLILDLWKQTCKDAGLPEQLS